MIKRMSKATSLLVAAAAIISIIPANAADYKKINSEDGTVYNAIAYKNGNFYIDGEIDDKDDASYYLANGKYTNLDDIDSGASAAGYGSKYVNVEEGDYFLDLETGKVTDDNLKDDAQDDAASALRKNIKKDTDGRYVKTDAETIKNLANKELIGNKFGQVWYQTQYTSLNDTNGFTTATPGQLNVYTDGKGSYIDADYNLGSIKVTTTSTAIGVSPKTVTVTNTDDKFDGAGLNDAVTSTVSTSSTVIGQDSSNIYRIAKITIKTEATVSVSKINGIDVTANAFNTSTQGEVSFNVIQKISKTQASGDIDGAKYAKSVTNYIIADDKGVDASVNLLTKYTVSNGKIITYKIDTTDNSVETATIILTSKNGYYYTDFKKKADEKAAVVDSNNLAVDTDVDGNLWRLSGGYIYRWDNNKDWEKIYKVDGSFNEISVYDKDNIVAWNENDEVYSVIGGTEAETPAEETPEVNTGWVQAPNGTWSYNKADGTKATGWLQDGAWYYLKADGVMATGWYNDNGTWYFLNGSGAMQTGWLNNNGTWYYLQSSGAMKTGWLNDNGTWYFLQSSGAMTTGWLNDNGTWYYLYSNGAMAANTVVDGYNLSSSGALK
ncbi:cell wall-binding protein [Clostridium beijerinckii]|nr:cell wall-binding protein [Clostridium beijerinckii]